MSFTRACSILAHEYNCVSIVHWWFSVFITNIPSIKYQHIVSLIETKSLEVLYRFYEIKSGEWLSVMIFKLCFVGHLNKTDKYGVTLAQLSESSFTGGLACMYNVFHDNNVVELKAFLNCIMQLHAYGELISTMMYKWVIPLGLHFLTSALWCLI